MKLLPGTLLPSVFGILLIMAGCHDIQTTAEVKKLAATMPAPTLIKQLARAGLNAEQLTLVRGWVAKARGKLPEVVNEDYSEVGIRTVMEEAGFAGRMDIIEKLTTADTLGAMEFISASTEQAALAGNHETVDHLLTLYADEIDVNNVLVAAARGNHLALVQHLSDRIQLDPNDVVWLNVAEEAGFNGSTTMIDLAKGKEDNCYISSCAVQGAVVSGDLNIVKREFPHVDNSTFPEENPADYYMSIAAKHGYSSIIAYLSDQSGSDIPLQLAADAALAGQTGVLDFMREAGVFNLNENEENYKSVVVTLLKSLFDATYGGHAITAYYIIGLIMSRPIKMAKVFTSESQLEQEIHGDHSAGDKVKFRDGIYLDNGHRLKSHTLTTETILTIAIIGAAQGDHPHIVDTMIDLLGVPAKKAYELSELPRYIEKALQNATQHGSSETVKHILRHYVAQAVDAEIFQEVRSLATAAGRWNIAYVVDKHIDTINTWINRIKKIIQLNSPPVVVLDQVSTIVTRGYQVSTQDADLILNYAVKHATKKRNGLAKSDVERRNEESLKLIDHAIKLGAKDFDTALHLAAGHADIVTRLEQAKAADLAETLRKGDIPKI